MSNIIARALSFNVFLQLLPICSALVSVPYAIEFFGLEFFSIFSISIAFLVGLNYLQFGVATNVNRELAAMSACDETARQRVFYTGLWAMILIALVVTISSFVLLPLFVDRLQSSSLEFLGLTRQYLFGVILQTPLVFLIIFLRAVLESELRFGVTATNRAVLNSCILCSPVLIGYFNLSLFSLVYIILGLHLIAFFFLAFQCRGYFLGSIFRFDTQNFIVMIRSGASLSFVSLGMLCFLYCDRYLVTVNIPLEEAAYFIAPFDILTRVSFIYGSIGAVFFPVFSQQVGEGKNFEFFRAEEYSYWLVFWVVFLVMFLIVVFTNELFDIWLGGDFSRLSAPFVSLLTLGVLFTGLTAIPGRALLALRQERILGYTYLVSSLLYILLSQELIKRFGAIGAASAFLVRSILELGFLNALLFFAKPAGERAIANHKLRLFLKTAAPIALLPAIFFPPHSPSLKVVIAFGVTIGVLIWVFRLLRHLRELVSSQTRKTIS